MNPDDMGHNKHTEIGDFCQENLFGQVRQLQLIATKLDWLRQFYYDVFHCDIEESLRQHAVEYHIGHPRAIGLVGCPINGATCNSQCMKFICPAIR